MTWKLASADAPPVARGAAVTRALDGHPGRALGLLWLDDRRLLSWGGDWALRLWEPTTGALLATYDDPARTVSGHGGIRGALVVATDRVLSWGYDGVINLWDLARPAPLARVQASEQAITGLVMVDAARFVSWSGDGALRLWRVDDLTENQELPWRPAPGDRDRLVMPFVLDGARGLIGWKYDELHYVPFDDAAPRHTVAAFTTATADDDDSDDDDSPDDIVAVIGIADGNLVAFARAGGVREWSLPTLRLVRDYEALATGARGACALADGGFAAWYAGRLAIYRAGDVAPHTVVDPPDDGVVDAVALTGGGLAYRTLQRRVVAWNDGEDWAMPIAPGREPLALVATPSDDVLLWGCRDGGVTVAGSWGTAALATDGIGVNLAVLHPAWPEERTLAAALAGGELLLADVAPSGAAPPSSPEIVGATRGLVAVPGDMVVAWSETGRVSVHDATSGATIRVLDGTADGSCGVIDGAMAVGDGRLVGWERAGSVYLWSLDGGQLIGVLDEDVLGPLGPTVDLAAARAISWSRLQERSGFLLWNVDRVSPIARLDHDGPALGAGLLPGGDLITWSESPAVRRWTLDGTLVETVPRHDDAIAGGLLTPAGLVTWTETELGLWAPDIAPRTVALAGRDGAIAGACGGDRHVLLWSHTAVLRVWDLDTNATRLVDAPAAGRIVHASWAGTGWVVVDDGGGVILCTPAGVARHASARLPVTRATQAEDGRWLAVASGRRLILIDRDRLDEPGTELSTRSRICAVTPVSRERLAVGLGDGSVAIATRSR